MSVTLLNFCDSTNLGQNQIWYNLSNTGWSDLIKNALIYCDLVTGCLSKTLVKVKHFCAVNPSCDNRIVF